MRKWISDLLYLPQDVTSGIPRIEMIGSHQVHVENYLGIEQFSSTEIKLKVREGSMAISGDDLKIKAIYPQFVAITGSIREVRYV